MSDPIRVLCVFSMLDRGGAENMCMNLYRNIDRNIIQFDFVKHSSPKGEFEDEIQALGGKIYLAPQYKLYNHFSYVCWWSGFLNGHPEYQIIHGHYYTIASVYLRVAKHLGRTTIAHSHNSFTDSKIKEIIQKPIEKYSDYCFACSDLAGKWLFPHRQFTVLKNAIDTKKFTYDSFTREEYRKSLMLQDELVLGTIANYSYAKNPLGLIDIFSTIHAKNSNTKLLWVGNGPMRAKIEQKIIETGAKDSILLMGTRSDVPALLQAMDCFLLPSFFEGLPVVLVEAQAAGLPCFVSDTVTREVDITGLCKFLPLDDSSRWVEAIFNDQTPRENTSQKIIDVGYDIHSTAKWLTDFYISALEEHENT